MKQQHNATLLRALVSNLSDSEGARIDTGYSVPPCFSTTQKSLGKRLSARNRNSGRHSSERSVTADSAPNPNDGRLIYATKGLGKVTGAGLQLSMANWVSASLTRGRSCPGGLAVTDILRPLSAAGKEPRQTSRPSAAPPGAENASMTLNERLVHS
jgi:hypothetical protein